MRYVKQFFFGIKMYARAFQFIFRHHLYWYFIIPAFLMLGIYQVGAWVKEHKIDYALSSFNDIVWFSFQMLIEISIAILLMKFAKYLVVVLLSPLLSHLSQRCEKILKGSSYPFSIKQLWKDVQRSVRIVIRNLMWEYFFFLIIFLVSYLGWEDPQSSPIFYLTFIIGFYYYGFSFLDYINERRKLDMDKSIIFIRKNRGLALAIGTLYSMLILLPVDLSVLFGFAKQENHTFAKLGYFFLQFVLWLLAAIAPVWAIVAATLSMYELNGIEPEEEIIELAQDKELQNELNE
jgi:CysZ protein